MHGFLFGRKALDKAAAVGEPEHPKAVSTPAYGPTEMRRMAEDSAKRKVPPMMPKGPPKAAPSTPGNRRTFMGGAIRP